MDTRGLRAWFEEERCPPVACLVYGRTIQNDFVRTGFVKSSYKAESKESRVASPDLTNSGPVSGRWRQRLAHPPLTDRDAHHQSIRHVAE
ncbi:hypothetical protein PtA15_3A70 [Puccinia triticina]|uniref:Uncharacterized protein n=1 Tax=Puccinia triticina TaxID=208348 RepID=A0ABY7CEX4_9BASI|nr:uncharacterized protein PtA15_3A70 [Puccinia triticina]WAQ82706.1 hypothetical protein PtA15_3A70 [Puccinia triticina]